MLCKLTISKIHKNLQQFFVNKNIKQTQFCKEYYRRKIIQHNTIQSKIMGEAPLWVAQYIIKPYFWSKPTTLLVITQFLRIFNTCIWFPEIPKMFIKMFIYVYSPSPFNLVISDPSNPFSITSFATYLLFRNYDDLTLILSSPQALDHPMAGM